MDNFINLCQCKISGTLLCAFGSGFRRVYHFLYHCKRRFTLELLSCDSEIRERLDNVLPEDLTYYDIEIEGIFDLTKMRVVVHQMSVIGKRELDEEQSEVYGGAYEK